MDQLALKKSPSQNVTQTGGPSALTGEPPIIEMPAKKHQYEQARDFNILTFDSQSDHQNIPTIPNY